MWYSIDIFCLVLEKDHSYNAGIWHFFLLMNGKEIVNCGVSIIQFMLCKSLPENEEWISSFFVLIVAIWCKRVEVTFSQIEENHSLSELSLLLPVSRHFRVWIFKISLIWISQLNINIKIKITKNKKMHKIQQFINCINGLSIIEYQRFLIQRKAQSHPTCFKLMLLSPKTSYFYLIS